MAIGSEQNYIGSKPVAEQSNVLSEQCKSPYTCSTSRKICPSKHWHSFLSNLENIHQRHVTTKNISPDHDVPSLRQTIYRRRLKCFEFRTVQLNRRGPFSCRNVILQLGTTSIWRTQLGNTTGPFIRLSSRTITSRDVRVWEVAVKVVLRSLMVLYNVRFNWESFRICVYTNCVRLLTGGNFVLLLYWYQMCVC